MRRQETRFEIAVLTALTLASLGDVRGSRPGFAGPLEHRHAAARTLLESRCLECHGPEAQESGLRLDSRAGLLRGGEFGPAAIMGQGTRSELIRRVTTGDPRQVMPPTGERLTAAEVASLTAWIDAGVPWDGAATDDQPTRDPRLEHWAWQPVGAPDVPATTGNFGGLPGIEPERNEIDLFVRQKLAAAGLAPSPVADRRTLIRRLTFDLIGLPPTPEEVDAFVADDDPAAYGRLVDRLLASPRYGERWARHWLDIVHYGDTHGYDKDKARPNAWPYRDYVIRAFNEDKPYARFVSEQVAGDVLYPDTRDGHEATGFIAAGPWDLIGHREVDESKADGKIARHLDRDDMVANTIGTFASVTIQCAQCHAHKFDPVSQDDYYSLQAVFAAIDRDDRDYPGAAADPGAVAAAEAELRALRAREQAIAGQLAAAAGPALVELEARAAAIRFDHGNPTPAFGYHSAIAGSAETEKWVQVDLGGPTKIREVVLHPCHDDYAGIGAGFGFPPRYRIQASDDPDFRSGVVTIADHTGGDVANPGVTAVRHAAETSGRFVRVVAPRLAERSSDFILAIAELIVIDDGGRNTAAGKPVTAFDSIEQPPRWARTNLVDGTSPAAARETLAGLKAEHDTLVARTIDPVLLAAREAIRGEIAAAEQRLAALRPKPAVVYGAASKVRGGKPRPIHLLVRGNVLTPAHEVGPGALSAVAALPARFELPAGHSEGERRAALARWLTDPANPLTWRSIVNRIWQYHFGRGIVETPGDFGRMGASPSHPELLDWLARRLLATEGSIKELHRLIVTSATYRQASIDRPDAAAADAGNRWLWRQRRLKLEAEGIRDAVLATAGTLDLTMGGPGWQDFKVLNPEHSPHYRYDLADPADPRSWRRGIYRFIVRSQTQPLMTVLDCADPSMRVERRNESLSAIQALALLNNGFMLVQASRFAERVEREVGSDPAAQVERAVRLALGRGPDPEEAACLAEIERLHGLANVCRVLFNLNEFLFID